MLNNIKINRENGFTIVELLIVIVVIAILAAISIVAYNGIQSRGKASAAESLASQVAKKAEAWNVIQSSYPNYCQFARNETNPTTGTPGVGTAGCTANASPTSGPVEAKLDNANSIRATTTTDEGSVQYQKCSGGGARVLWVGGDKSGTISLGTATGTCNATGVAP